MEREAFLSSVFHMLCDTGVVFLPLASLSPLLKNHQVDYGVGWR